MNKKKLTGLLPSARMPLSVFLGFVALLAFLLLILALAAGNFYLLPLDTVTLLCTAPDTTKCPICRNVPSGCSYLWFCP